MVLEFLCCLVKEKDNFNSFCWLFWKHLILKIVLKAASKFLFQLPFTVIGRFSGPIFRIKGGIEASRKSILNFLHNKAAKNYDNYQRSYWLCWFDRLFNYLASFLFYIINFIFRGCHACRTIFHFEKPSEDCNKCWMWCARKGSLRIFFLPGL